MSTGIAVLQLEIPDLSSRVKQKRAEVLETKANLRLLEIGSRPEEIAEQRQRVQRARVWRDLAEQDLQRLRQALKAEMTKLEHKIKECQTEMETALQKKQRLLKLRSNNAVSPEELEDAEKHYKIWKAQCEQAKAEKRAREAKGTLEAEGELARRDKELAEARAALTLLEAGSRPEKIEAERARLVRLQEEVCYLEQLQAKLVLHSPVAGVVSTPHLKEKIGQYFEEGELICVVEEDNRFEAEIVLAEQDLDAVRIGQKVDLKARSLPFDTITATVERIAPTAEKGDVQSQVTVSCWLPRSTPALRSGLTGYARIYTERRPLGEIALQRVLRYLRTEFWW